MEFWQYLVIASVLAGPFVYVVRASIIHVAQAAINKEAKGIAVEQVLKQVGLNRAKVKDFNDLTPQGVASLVTVIRAVQASSAQGVAGPQFAAIQKAMADLQGFSQLASSLGGQGVRPNVSTTAQG